MTHVIASVNSKGGSGKSTTTAQLAVCLNNCGKRVLIIDTDPQCSLSKMFLDEQPEDTILNIYENKPLSPIHTYRDGLDLIAGNKNMSGILTKIAADIDAMYILKEAIEKIEGYDYIMIDNPAGINGLTLSAIIATKYIIIPISVQLLTVHALDDTLDAYTKIKKRLNPDVDILGIIPTLFDKRTVICRELLEQINLSFKGKVFNCNIPKTVLVEEAQAKHKGLIDCFPNTEISQQFNNLAGEVIHRIEAVSAEKSA